MDWAAHLRGDASRMALLALRTDPCASHERCQRATLLAKRNGIQVVLLDPPHRGEDRGSFPMDNVVRVRVRPVGGGCIDAGLARLVGSYRGACTKRCSASSRGPGVSRGRLRRRHDRHRGDR